MRSITRRLVEWHTLILAGTLLICGLAAFFGMRYLLMSEAAREVNASMITVQRMAAPEEKDLDAPELTASIDNGILWVQITSQDGRVLNSSSALRGRAVVPGYVGPPITYELDGQRVLLAGARLPHGTLVQIVRPLNREEGFLTALGGVLGLLALAGLLLALFGGLLLTRTALKPIQSLTQTATRITTTDLGSRIPLSGPHDELYELGETLNQMLARLEEGFDGQREFLTAASHDLRTPLAVIKSYADILNRWGKDDPAVVAEAIPAIYRAVTVMERLVNDLLFLAKMQTRPAMNFVPLRLDSLVAEVVQEAQAVAGGISVELQSVTAVRAAVDADYLRRAIWILIDNAIRYNLPDGKVIVSVHAGQRGEAVITVADTGPGIASEDLPRIFDRFFRGDRARGQGNGFGLGLSLAKEIVEAHGGKITVSSTPGRGSTFSIVLAAYA